MEKLCKLEGQFLFIPLLVLSALIMSSIYLSKSKDSINFKELFRTKYPSSSTPFLGKRSKGRRVYVCLHCPLEFKIPSNAVFHARTKHSELVRELEDAGEGWVDAMDSQLSSSTPGLGHQQSMSSFVSKTASTSSLRNVFNAQRYHEAVVGLLTKRRVPFSSVEWSEMEELALACNPSIKDCLITTRYKAMKLIDANYGLYLGQLREQLKESQSMIHLSTDMWTSPHRHGMLGVCAQWVDKNYVLRKALLAMPECQFSHSGDAQASLIMDVIHTFGISRIGYHVGDNASSNDTCLEALAVRLRAELEVC